MKKKSERERASEKKEWSRVERGGEREVCPKQAAIKRALKKGQKKKTRRKPIHNRQSK